MRSAATRMWSEPSGLREVLGMALPLVVSTLSWTAMQFTDRVFLMWYSADAVAAALPAAAVNFVVMCFPLGVASYVNAFVSQYYGAQRYHRIGLVVWQGVWIGALVVPISALTIPLSPWLFEGVGHPAQIAQYEVDYYDAMAWGAGPMVAAAALSSFFSGRGRVRTVMVVDSAASLTNVVLDYAWIFGHWGFGEWGVAGAAWATVVSLWLKLAVYLALFLAPAFADKYATRRGCRFDSALFKRLLWFGSPNGAQFFFEVTAFTLFLLVVGRLGQVALAATSLAFNVNNLAFMPVYGIGIATTTLVGQRLGQNDPHLAARATWSAFILAAGYMLSVSALYVGAPGWLLWAYGTNVAPGEFGDLQRLTTILLRFVAFFSVFDAMVIIFSSAIKGAGDARFVLLVTLGMSPLPVVATVIGVELLGYGLYWSWVAITAWVCVLGVIYMARFRQGKWRTMRVIEKTPIDDEPDVEPDGEPQAVAALGGEVV